MAEILILVILTCLVCFGVHAVTRPKRLLWFLAVRIHLKEDLYNLQQELKDKENECFNSYEFDVNKIYEQFGQDVSSAEAEKALKSAADIKYDKQTTLSNDYGLRIDRLVKTIELKARKQPMRTLLMFAPMLTECPTCMASFWGTVVYTLYSTGLITQSIFCVPVLLPIFLLAVAGTNDIVARLTSR